MSAAEDERRHDTALEEAARRGWMPGGHPDDEDNYTYTLQLRDEAHLRGLTREELQAVSERQAVGAPPAKAEPEFEGHDTYTLHVPSGTSYQGLSLEELELMIVAAGRVG